jgi:hypothetical protein
MMKLFKMLSIEPIVQLVSIEETIVTSVSMSIYTGSGLGI